MWFFILFVAILILVLAIFLYSFIAGVVENEDWFLIIVGLFFALYIGAAFLVYKLVDFRPAPSNIGSFLQDGIVHVSSTKE
ncbi:hypothetical protein FJZ48_00140 [Candidatus Uhrbacteria bacterium]|nr:hypothetical protein [Candidatus Uhrbacteria bacterium]